MKRRGSTYIMVLASSMIVTVIGLASLLAIRVQRRTMQMTNDAAEARLCAQAAVELGLLYVKDQNWRSTWTNGTWLSNQPLGSGSFSLEGIDPRDSHLADSLYDPVILTGSGTKGTAVHKTQITLVPAMKPLEVLDTCIHASNQIIVDAGKQITVVGAPISTNGLLNNDGVIDGDAEAVEVGSSGTITGTLTVPADTKQLPDTEVISKYIDKATVVPYSSTVDEEVLTPWYNPWGSANSDGVYYINADGQDLTIKNTRIYGTLVVRTGNKTLTLDEAVFMQSYRPFYPALIVDGKVKIKYKSGEYTLSENSCDTNFNPSGAPYLGQTDADTLDEYPNEIQGLVHVTGELVLEQTALIRGAVICEDKVKCHERNVIIHDPALYASPPEGYIFVDGVQVSPGSCRQVVD